MTHIGCSGSAAAEVHDRVGPPLRGETARDSCHPTPGQVAGTDSLSDRVAEHYPKRETPGEGGGPNLAPLVLERVHL